MGPRLQNLSRVAMALGVVLACAVSAGAPTDPLEPARAALRTLQFTHAIELLDSASRTGSANAQYLLGLMYLNGIGTGADTTRARTLLQSATQHGHGAAAYVLASELARDPAAPATSARQWLDRSAKLGYVRAIETLKSGRLPLAAENLGATDPVLLPAWVIDSARRNDGTELQRLGAISLSVHDAFGRGPLSYAAQAGAVAAATALLQLGADVQAADAAGTTALMLAAQGADPGLVSLLLQHGADPRAVDALHRTALFYAARANRPAAIAALRAAGASLDAQDERGYNALDDALAVGASQAAQALQSEGLHAHRVAAAASPGGEKFDPLHPGELYRGWPPLALAVARNDTAQVRQLLDGGAPANARLPQGDGLLRVAVDAHAMDSVPLLLAHGADSTIPDHAGHSILWLAATRGDLTVIQALTAGGVPADTHAANEPTPLLAAVRAHRTEAAQKLLEAGANPDAVDGQGHTALMIAAQTRQFALLQLLLAHHAQLEPKDAQKRTALWHAAAHGSVAEVGALLSAGARPDAADANGLTVLHAAARNGADIVQALPVSTAMLDGRSAAGDTPLIIAAATGHADIVRVLLEHHAQLNTQNYSGDTALIAAARGGYEPICKLLQTAGANTALRTVAGASAADLAASRGFTSIARDLATRSL